MSNIAGHIKDLSQAKKENIALIHLCELDKYLPKLGNEINECLKILAPEFVDPNKNNQGDNI